MLLKVHLQIFLGFLPPPVNVSINLGEAGVVIGDGIRVGHWGTFGKVRRLELVVELFTAERRRTIFIYFAQVISIFGSFRAAVVLLVLICKSSAPGLLLLGLNQPTSAHRVPKSAIISTAKLQ